MNDLLWRLQALSLIPEGLVWRLGITNFSAFLGRESEQQPFSGLFTLCGVMVIKMLVASGPFVCMCLLTNDLIRCVTVETDCSTGQTSHLLMIARESPIENSY